MKIRTLQLRYHFKQVPEARFCFQSGLTFIRGENGAGKTILLEASALLGHTPILRRATDRISTPAIELCAYLSQNDVTFLREVFGGSFDPRATFDSEVVKIAREVLDGALGAAFWSEASLERVRTWLDKQPGDLKDAPIQVAYTSTKDDSNTGRPPELKLSLADDQDVRDDWVCVAEEAIYELIGLLMSWSRPERVEGAEERRWRLTPRTVSRTKRSVQPGIVSYINTDMYDYGIGLDLRESPKHLEFALAPVIVDRLQLFDRADETGPFVIRGYERLKDAWEHVLPDEGQGLSRFVFWQKKYGPPARGTWDIELGPGSGRSFVSSGENQLLFLFSMIFALEPRGGILLMDEPELHLSFLASRNLIEELLALAEEMDIQIVVATHTPFLFRECITTIEEDLSDRFPDVRTGEQADVQGNSLLRKLQGVFRSRMQAPKSRRALSATAGLIYVQAEPIYHRPAFNHLSQRYQHDLEALMHSMEVPADKLSVRENTRHVPYINAVGVGYLVALVFFALIALAKPPLDSKPVVEERKPIMVVAASWGCHFKNGRCD